MIEVQIDDKQDAYIQGVRVGRLTPEGKLELFATDDGSAGFKGTVIDLLKFELSLKDKCD